jgi:TRAP-type C4-dicarboxylate transport system substrate-binding protein
MPYAIVNRVRPLGVLAAAGVMLAGVAAEAQERITWRVALFGPPRAVTRGVEYYAKLVEEKTGGKFIMRLHYNEQLSDAKDHLDGILAESFQVAHVPYNYAPGKTPLATALDMPFLPLATPQVIRRVTEDFYTFQPLIDELKRWNAKALVANPLPPFEFMGTGKPPRALADWKGMRVRALGGSGDAMRQIGAIPTTVTAPEVYIGLERGMFQAVSFPFTFAFGAYKLHEISKWYTAGINIGTVHNSILVSDKAFNQLPAEYRKLLVDNKEGFYQALYDAYEADDRKWIPIFEAKGLEKIVIPPKQLAEFQEKAAKPVWDAWIAEFEAKGLPARQTFDFVFDSATRHSKGS